MSYTPPLYTAVEFNGAAAAYTPPGYGAVYFDDTAVILALPPTTIALSGVGPAVLQTANSILIVPPTTIALVPYGATINQSFDSTTGTGIAPHQHRSLLGGVSSFAFPAHRMVLGGFSQEGVRAGHRSVIGGMAKEGPALSGAPDNNHRLTLPAKEIAITPVAPAKYFAIGVHPDVRLWVRFLDNDPRDWSIYEQTPVVTGANIVNNRMEQYWDDTVDTDDVQQVAYTASSALTSPGVDFDLDTGWTIEGFITWNASPPNSNPGFIFVWYQAAPYEPTSNGYRFEQYSSAGDVKLKSDAFGDLWGPTSSHPLAPAGTKYHWAWTRPATGGGVRTEYFYINGVLVGQFDTGRFTVAAPDIGEGRMVIGGILNSNGFPGHVSDYYLGETRVVARDLYPGGTSFTPPTEGNLIAIT